MEHEYIFNETYGDSVNSVVVEFDSDDHVLTWRGYGDYAIEINACQTVKDFRDVIAKHWKEIEEVEENRTYSNKELFEELLTFCDLTIDFNTIKNLQNEVFLLKNRMADLELENLKLKQEKDTVIELYNEVIEKSRKGEI